MMHINILAIDDVEANLYSLENLIDMLDIKRAEFNLTFLKATSGEEGLKIAMDQPIDLIILDIQMPEMNGFEVAKFLKSNYKTKDIPIIFVTAAFKSEEFVRNGFELGAVDYFVKPIEKNSFLNRIKLYVTIMLKNKAIEESDAELKLLNLSLEERIRQEVEKNVLQAREVYEKELELLKQNEIFEIIFHCAKDGIAIFDLDSRFLHCNHSCLEIFESTEEEILTKTCLDFSVPEDIEKSQLALQTLLEKGFVENFEKTCITKNKNIVILSITLSLMPDRDKVIAIFKNITENKLFESQAKLASMGEMIGNIAHQWRQPLSIITTSASSIAFKYEMNQLKFDEIIPSMDLIVHQAEYLSKTIDDFRNFIRGGETKEIISISTLIEKTLSIVNPSLKNNFVKVIINIDDTLKIYGYENELMQALINILNNAKDALVANEALQDRVIFIDGKQHNEKCEITIKDNGGGILSSAINHIFEPYFTTKHKNIGTGLGLAMSYKIVTDIHNGTIVAFNETFEWNQEQCKGACFILQFDLER